MKQVLFIVFLELPFYAIADTTTAKSLITQTIVYKTAKASEIYLVWTMDNWKIPDKSFQPASTYLFKGMAYTKMHGSKDSFDITLKLPK